MLGRGIVIAAIHSGMRLLGFGASIQYRVTALALRAAVVSDAVGRRNRPATAR